MPPAPTTAASRPVGAEPALTVRLATRSDLPSITKILHTNLLTFEFFDHSAPRRRERLDGFYVWVLRRVRMFFARPDVRYVVAVVPTTTGGVVGEEVVGFATWMAPPPSSSSASGTELAGWAEERAGVWHTLERTLVGLEGWYFRHFLNSVVDSDKFARCWALLLAAEESSDEAKQAFHLQWLMVAPEWQRGHGVGSKLLRWGLELAEKDGVPVILESSLAGFKFYLREGFQVLSMVRMDVEPKYAYDMPVLLYRPRRQRQGK